MLRPDWRRLLLTALVAAWLAFVLLRGCDGGRPRPTELLPRKRQSGRRRWR
jgi:hypothetical protein